MKLGNLALTIAAGAALSSAANAQMMGGMAGTGLFAEGGIGIRSSNIEIRNAFGPDTVSTDMGERGMVGSLRAGWRSPMPGFDFGVSAFWNPADEGAGTTRVGGTSIRLKQWEHWGAGVEAGWKPGPATTIYGRLDWHRAKFSVRTTVDGLAARSNRRHNGYGYGFGVRHMFDQNAYVFAEWQQVEFQRRRYGELDARARPHNTLGLIGVGWTF